MARPPRQLRRIRDVEASESGVEQSPAAALADIWLWSDTASALKVNEFLFDESFGENADAELEYPDRDGSPPDLQWEPIEDNTRLKALLEEAAAEASRLQSPVAAEIRLIQSRLCENVICEESAPSRPVMAQAPVANAGRSALHPGLLLKEAIGDRASVAQIAHGIGVTRQALNVLLIGKVRLTPRMATLLEAGQIIDNAERWLALQRSYDLKAELDAKPPEARRSRRPMPT